jgi:hypothetical protein
MLASVERRIDPDFNPAEQLRMHPDPPNDGDIEWPIGVSPVVIRNPEARAAYEEAIRRNIEKNTPFGAQVELRRCVTTSSSISSSYRRTSFARRTRDGNSTTR